MTRVLRWGNSLAVKIPAGTARAIGLVHGSEVELRRDKDHLVIECVHAAPTLEQLLAGVTAENLHRDFEWQFVDERGRDAG